MIIIMKKKINDKRKRKKFIKLILINVIYNNSK